MNTTPDSQPSETESGKFDFLAYASERAMHVQPFIKSPEDPVLVATFLTFKKGITIIYGDYYSAEDGMRKIPTTQQEADELLAPVL